jgi:hypothetical protein
VSDPEQLYGRCKPGISPVYVSELDLLHLDGILFINPRCTETRNSNALQCL